MENYQNSRIMIAGTNSGCGKTTITCAVLKALIMRGLKVAAFKCGPDYIDPMFHTEVVGAESRNLDMFLCGEDAAKYLLVKNGRECDISVIEGVMGFYDGLGMEGMEYSSCDLSNKTKTPVILVVNCAGMAYSVAAMIKGYMDFNENQVVGVILNNTSKAMYTRYKECIEQNLSVQVLGFMPKQKDAVFESRHLGLVTAEEISSLDAKLDILCNMAEKYIDLDDIIALARSAPLLTGGEMAVERQNPVKIAIARDRAFCFYYEDSLELLRQMGADLIPFSPLKDKSLPDDIDGLILGGGYPELYLKKLSENVSMLSNIRSAVLAGLPTYAECGGFMYLGETIANGHEKHRMVGAINTNTVLTRKLQNFGYVFLKAKEDNLFCRKGQGIRAHEFHYSSSDNPGSSFRAAKKNKFWDGCFGTSSLYAGYPHFHFWGNRDFAKSFLIKCWNYRKGLKEHETQK